MKPPTIAEWQSMYKRAKERDEEAFRARMSDEQHLQQCEAALGLPVTPTSEQTERALISERASLLKQVAELQAKLAAAEQALDDSEHRRVADKIAASPEEQRVARASIVAFLEREAARFDRAADQFEDDIGNSDAGDRCRTKAGQTRTLAAQVARGDDRNGSEQ